MRLQEREPATRPDDETEPEPDPPVWGHGPFAAATVRAATAGQLVSPARAS